MLTLRRVLESGAAEAAAARALTPAERQHLRAALTEVDEVGTGSGAEYRRRDSRLHLAIAEVTAAPSLTTAVAEVRTRVNELLDAIPLLAANIEHSNVQHRAIVAAILSGDPPAARGRDGRAPRGHRGPAAGVPLDPLDRSGGRRRRCRRRPASRCRR